MLVIDTNTDCTSHTGSLKNRGVTHVGRYYASSKWKRISPAEAKALSKAGLQIIAIFEDSGKPPLTVEAGEHDARIALAQAEAAGQTAGTPIYFAMENLPNGYNASHLPGLKAYFQGVGNILGTRYAVGAYSNGLTLATLLDAGAIRYAWVSASTSFVGSKDFLKTPRWHLAQRLIDKDWDGVSVDTNDCRGDFGSWALPVRDSIDTAVRQVVQGSAGSVAATVTADAALEAPTRAVVADVATGGEAKPGLFDRLAPNASKIEDLAGQGSRIAEHLKSFKAMLWKGAGTAVTLGGAGATLIDPSKGNAQAAGSWGASHPFLLAALCVGVTAAIIAGYAYYKAKKIEKGLVSAADSKRYFPRGGAPA